MTGAADTSWLIALLNSGDAHHDAARREAERHDLVYVPPAALMETLNLIQKRARRAKTGEAPHATALRALDVLASQPTVVLDQPAHNHEAAVRIWRAQPKLSYSDAAVIAAAYGKSVDLLTFDRAQAAAHRSWRP